LPILLDNTAALCYIKGMMKQNKNGKGGKAMGPVSANGYVETIEVLDEAEVKKILAARSRDGGAWVAEAAASGAVRLYRFPAPSRIPDRFINSMRMWDMGSDLIGWRGKLQGFREAVIIREQNCAYSADR